MSNSLCGVQKSAPSANHVSKHEMVACSRVMSKFEKRRKKANSSILDALYVMPISYEPTPHKSVDYRAFRLQITTEGIIEIFAQ